MIFCQDSLIRSDILSLLTKSTKTFCIPEMPSPLVYKRGSLGTSQVCKVMRHSLFAFCLLSSSCCLPPNLIVGGPSSEQPLARIFLASIACEYSSSNLWCPSRMQRQQLYWFSQAIGYIMFMLVAFVGNVNWLSCHICHMTN